MGDPYAILQVQPTAHPDVIAAAYRALARLYHPDSGGDERAMMALNQAWDILRDPARRAAYDAVRRVGLARPAQPAAPAHSEHARQPEAAPTPPADSGRRAADPSILDFGRYEGNSIAQVARIDPDYLLWLERTPIGRRFGREIAEQLATRKAVPARPQARQARRWAALDARR